MKKAVLLSAALFSGAAAFAQLPTTVISNNITADRTFSSDTIYQLDGFVYVKNNATLTIEAGTVVQGYIDGQGVNSKGTLIVTRDGYIDAQGTECEPIVFTSAKAPGLRGAGDWGGVIILGEATINRGTDAGGYFTDIIEGGLTGNDVADRTYGGTNDQDSSGILRYARIEFAGIAFTPNNEINSLTTGGVGEKTVIDHIQVSYAGDDAFEMFGGKWNSSHLIALRTLDDNFDCDQGYRGNIQWGIVYQEANTADISKSEGWENDNWKSNPNALPRTAPVFSNVTLVGPAATGTPNSLHQSAARIRRGAWTSIHNSVFVDHVNGLFIDGDDTYAGWNSGMEFKGNLMAGMNAMYKAAGAHTVADMRALWMASNDTMASTSMVGLNADYDNITDPNLVPDNGSTLLSGADWTFTGASDFSQVSYRGAMDQSGDWTANWTEWDPQTADYTNGVGGGIDGLTASAPGNYTISLNWTSTGAGTYWVYFRAVGASSFTRIVANTNSRDILNREPGSYEVYVTEVGDANASCVETVEITCDDFSYNVNTFQIVDDTDGKIFVNQVNGGKRTWDFGLINENGDTTWRNNAFAHRFRDLIPGDYTVIVKDGFDCYSSTMTNVTINPIDSATLPTLINVSGPGTGTALTANWSNPGAASCDAYQVRVRDITAGAGPNTVLVGTYIATGGATTSYTVTGLYPGRFRFDVRSRLTGGAFGGRVYSNFKERILSSNKNGATAAASAAGVVGTYPNPVANQLFVAAEQGADVTLMDMNGRVIAQQSIENTEVSFDMSELANGMYIVRIVEGENVITEKVIKE